MVRSAVTVSLVEEARKGPFVFHDGLQDACTQAAELGFDAIEIFAPGPDVVDADVLKPMLQQHGLAVAAVGTGAGMVRHGLSLTDADPEKRTQAVEFVQSMIDFGAVYQAPAIIGSMQGKWGGDVSRETALGWLAESLEELGSYADSRELPLFYEPLNRYETNLLTTVGDAADFVRDLKTTRIRLLADLFHMNIEEADIAEALRANADVIGHIHFVDSNRRAAGGGHMDYAPIAEAVRESDYDGYLSAEAFALPNSRAAAEQTIATYRKYWAE